MGARAQRREQGRASGTVLVFLLLLGVLGAWNYQRNLALEVPQPRPFRGYSDADLRVLEAAQRAEVAARDARYAALAARRVEVRDAGFGQAAADEFERVQRLSRARREAGHRASEQQAMLDALERERALRAQPGGAWTVHLLRLVRI